MLRSAYYRNRILVIMFAMIAPIVCVATAGWLPSLSSYWNTPMQPLFIITNAATSYYLFFESGWKRSAMALMLLTAFSIDYWPVIHNVLAVCFFLLTLIPMYQTKRFRWVIWAYIASAVGVVHSLLLAELIGITLICVYNLLLLQKSYALSMRNSNKK